MEQKGFIYLIESLNSHRLKKMYELQSARDNSVWFNTDGPDGF